MAKVQISVSWQRPGTLRLLFANMLVKVKMTVALLSPSSTRCKTQVFFTFRYRNGWAGKGRTSSTFIDAIAEIGEADGGTAWATALLNVCTWFATLFSEQAQQDVFGQNQGARVCGIFTPPQISERTFEGAEGGLRVTGEWGYASGSNHADWAVLGVKLGDNPDGSPILGLGLIPMADLTIKDTWYVAGMRASGSNTLVAENVFVPNHRIHSYDALAAEDYLRSKSNENNDYASFIPVAEIILCGAQLGLVRAAIQQTIKKGGSKNVAYTIFTEARNSPAHQIQLAEAASEGRSGGDGPF